ncbi:hypothetical protein HanIR_Chr15g0770151 [Helianthus annuus]|nr:hypothetical protein HanIR_Chr15g0770151 [Helianthus annuus]
MSLGSSSQIFAGAFSENYEPPPGGFNFEVNDDSPIVQKLHANWRINTSQSQDRTR